jgi:Zn-dependent peptidase ImmA (M78 family)/transcriptional regulator with XRE-family HTH domain
MSGIVRPEMLVLARESRGLTQGDLAAAVGVSQAKISKYESRLLGVAPDDLERIARVLAYPVDFFFQTDDVRSAGSTCLYHRKRQSMPVKELRRIQARVNIARMQMARLLRGAQVENENQFPRMDVDEYDGPEEVARLVRKSWGLPPGPVANLVQAVENAGGIVYRCSFGTRKLDAISQWFAGLPPLFFINADAPTDRCRYSLAHEIAHVVMHRVPTPDQESEADRFAAEFLMPAKDIGPHLRPITIQKAAALKPCWKVSMAALIKRASDLGKIGESYYRKLYTQLSKLGYRLNEPAPIPDEEPTVLRDIIEVHLRDHNYSIAELSRALVSNEQEFISQYLPERQHFRLVD